MKVKNKDIFLKNTMYVLRDKKTDKALNVSYSPHGLKYTQNKTGRYIYDENRHYIERFIPKDFKNKKLLKYEIIWAVKGKHMLYG
jgi:hypothetical protein